MTQPNNQTNQTNQTDQAKRDASGKEKETPATNPSSGQQKPWVVTPISASQAASASQSKTTPAASGEKEPSPSPDKKAATQSV